MKKIKIDNLLRLALAIIFSELVGIFGSFFTFPAIPTWYVALPKPPLNPPTWIFGPVWTFLFLLMGISIFLIWKKYKEASKKSVKANIRIAIGLFVLQMELNVLWSIVFFGLENPKLAFVEVIIFWLSIFATIVAFSKISKPAMWLLIPYIVWVSFACYLNFSIWQLSDAQKAHFAQPSNYCGQKTEP